MERNKLKKALGFLGACSIIIILSACIGNPVNGKEINPEAIFFDYKISGEEGNDSVTVMLQFRLGGAYGPTIGIEEPGNVRLDGELIPADNSSLTGPFYPVTKHIKQFTGKHSIVFTNLNNKKYKEEFTFKPFSLITRIGDTISRKKLIVDLSGLDKEDYVRILLTDTSFAGEGVNRLDTVVNNRLIIYQDDLSKLENGPIQLEFIREYEREIENSTWVGGFISIVYNLRREFFLKD